MDDCVQDVAAAAHVVAERLQKEALAARPVARVVAWQGARLEAEGERDEGDH